MKLLFFTIGHPPESLEEFIELLVSQLILSRISERLGGRFNRDMNEHNEVVRRIEAVYRQELPLMKGAVEAVERLAKRWRSPSPPPRTAGPSISC